MAGEVNNTSASYATADGPELSTGMDAGYVDALSSGSDFGSDYSVGGRIGNWFTGQNTAAEKRADIANQRAMAIWNASEAQKDRDFQERMSDTAITRAVADAERNGINKYYLLSSGLTASTPSGASSSANYEPLNASGSRSLGGGLFALVRAVIGAYLAYKFGPEIAAKKALASETAKQAAEYTYGAKVAAAKAFAAESAKEAAKHYLVDTHGAPLR